MKNMIALTALFMIASHGAMAATASKGRVLLVASSTDTLILKDGRKDPTGFYLGELYVPAQRLIDEGYEIVVATPSGKKPVVDKASLEVESFDSKEEFDRALNFVATYTSMQKPITLKQAEKEANSFVAVYVPGGHAPMNDLIQDPNLGRILQSFHAAGKPTAFLCHGPVASLAALPAAKKYRAALVEGEPQKIKKYSQNWIYAGYKMTVFSNVEEYVVEEKRLHGNVPFYSADALQFAGGQVSNGPKWESYVVRDRELITGQNPKSDKDIASKLVEALKESKGN